MGVFAEKIVSVEQFEGEYQETYDIEVSHWDHNFLTGDGFVVSNSHACAYSMNAYLGAYVKANYPLVFYKVVMDRESDKGIMWQLFQEAKIRNVKVNPFDINRNDYEFKFDVKTNEMLAGFRLMKGISKVNVEAIMKERDESGTFDNIVDFFVALENISVTIRTIEPLIKLGAFDSIYKNRKELFELYKLFQTYKKKKNLKTPSLRWKLTDIFKMVKKEKIKDYTIFEQMTMEFKYLEMYLFSSPLDVAKKWYDKQGVRTVSITERENDSDNVLGFLADIKVKKTKNKDNYLDITFTDVIDSINVKVWSNKICAELQEKGNVAIMRLEYNELFNSYNLRNFHVFREK